MKVISVFDTYADSHQVKEAISGLKGIKGIKSIEVMERTSGEVPRYCIIYDIDDEDAEDTIQRVKWAGEQYSSYVSNNHSGAYKKIG